jgi:hypothetical protein
VIHAAGCHSDGWFTSQDPQKVAQVFHPKVRGAWNLYKHLLLDPFSSNGFSHAFDLRRLVLFSSISSLLGSPGQTNYCAANAFLDSLATRSDKIVALQFPFIREVGMGADLVRRSASASEDQSSLAIFLPQKQFHLPLECFKDAVKMALVTERRISPTYSAVPYALFLSPGNGTANVHSCQSSRQFQSLSSELMNAKLHAVHSSALINPTLIKIAKQEQAAKKISFKQAFSPAHIERVLKDVLRTVAGLDDNEEFESEEIYGSIDSLGVLTISKLLQKNFLSANSCIQDVDRIQ